MSTIAIRARVRSASSDTPLLREIPSNLRRQERPPGGLAIAAGQPLDASKFVVPPSVAVFGCSSTTYVALSQALWIPVKRSRRLAAATTKRRGPPSLETAID